MTTPAYQRIKAYLLSRIEAGDWREDDRVPSEPALARQFGVARMTVNRAVRELAGEHRLRRVPGSGTFVAKPRHESTLLRIRPIAEEIRERGAAHSADVLRLEAVEAEAGLAAELELKRGARLFHSCVLHREDGQPVQYEERWVVPAVAPDYLRQDFSLTTPSEYLLKVAPLARAEYGIEARAAPPSIGAALKLEEDEPCLLVHRRTYSRGRAASAANLWNPGSRYRLTGHV